MTNQAAPQLEDLRGLSHRLKKFKATCTNEECRWLAVQVIASLDSYLNVVTPPEPGSKPSSIALAGQRAMQDYVDRFGDPRKQQPEHVAWLRMVTGHEKATRLQFCDSDTPGAFKVFRLPPEPKRGEVAAHHEASRADQT